MIIKPGSDILIRMSKQTEDSLTAKLEEKLLGSRASANFLIFTLIFLVAMMFVGIGVFATNRIASSTPFVDQGAQSTPSQ